MDFDFSEVYDQIISTSNLIKIKKEYDYKIETGMFKKTFRVYYTIFITECRYEYENDYDDITELAWLLNIPKKTLIQYCVENFNAKIINNILLYSSNETLQKAKKWFKEVIDSLQVANALVNNVD